MNAGSGSLEALRREIDTIDDQMHDLLMQRVEIVRRIGALKGPSDAVIYRPEREAQLLRRLVGRHHGTLPVTDVARVWREVLTASTRLQGDFSLGVFRSDADLSVWQIALSHFGGDTPAIAYNSPSQVINAVTRGEASIGLLPMPQQDDKAPWWPTLLGEDVPRVVSRLPFIVTRTEAAHDGRGAMVIARNEALPSGADRSLLVMEIGVPASRGKVVETLAGSGIMVGQQIVQNGGDTGGSRLHLLDVEDYVTADDARLASAGMLLDTVRVTRLGGYATPITVAA